MRKFNNELHILLLFKEFSDWNRNPAYLRFGQYIVNKYLVLGESAPEIFYEENSNKAFDLIVQEIAK